jgi:anti-sigma B factor antagonist
MDRLKIQISQHGEATIVTLSGAADMNEVFVLDKKINELLKGSSHTILFELSELNFTCSLGLSTLIKTLRICRDHGGECCLINPHSHIQRILKTTRLDKLFRIFPSAETALAEMKHE